MKTSLSILLLFWSTTLSAQVLDTYHWKNRVILLVSPNETEADYLKQIQQFKGYQAELDERDLVVFHWVGNKVNTPTGELLEGKESQAIREKYQINPAEGFSCILLGKDGYEKLRKTTFVPLEELFALIDAMPMRKREMKRQKP